MKYNKINNMESAHIKFSMGDFFSKEIKKNTYSIIFNDELPTDIYLNHATNITAKNNIQNFIDRIENTFKKHGSIPAFYITPTTTRLLKKVLLKRNYEIFDIDSWMTPTKKIKSQLNVRKINNNEIGEFVKVFTEVYTKGEEDDPYKNMSSLYGTFLKRRLITRHRCKTEPFAAFLNDKIIGTIYITYDKNYACAYGLAVLPKYRNKGAGRSLLSKCVELAKELRVELFLQTSKGSRNEKIFKKLGFKTVFAGEYLYKSQKS